MTQKGTFFHRLFVSIADSGRALIERQIAGAREQQVDKVVDLCRALISQRGEASGAALSREALNAYNALEEDDRLKLFDALAEDFEVDHDAVISAADAYKSRPGSKTLTALTKAVQSPRLELFRRFNMAPGGTAALVDLRRRLLALESGKPGLDGINQDLIHLFGSWFNRGFLTLEEITWHTPAVILEKLIQYESVHAIDGWDDLRRRLEADRRCFAFFHPSLPEDPLIFLEVALVQGMTGSIAPLLDPAGEVGDPNKADTAIFYSINNCQTGLRGISFGNFLIKQVAAELATEFPNIKTFATLSPVPGFLSWLKKGHGFKDGEDAARLAEAVKKLELNGWHRDEVISGDLRALLEPACAWYLTQVLPEHEKRDPVAQFHLGNGASIERINWLGDISDKGLEQSAGIMVNYLYQLKSVESNHEAFVNEGKVAASSEVEKLARGAEFISARDKPA